MRFCRVRHFRSNLPGDGPLPPLPDPLAQLLSSLTDATSNRGIDCVCPTATLKTPMAKIPAKYRDLNSSSGSLLYSCSIHGPYPTGGRSRRRRTSFARTPKCLPTARVAIGRLQNGNIIDNGTSHNEIAHRVHAIASRAETWVSAISPPGWAETSIP